MTLKIHGRSGSTKSRSVAHICKEIGVPYEFVPVDTFGGEQHLAPHRARQPFGQIPFIDDDGFVVYESRACARYIATKFAAASPDAPRLIINPGPGSLEAYARFEQAAHIELCAFEPYAYGIYHEVIVKPRRGFQTDAVRLQEDIDSLNEKLDVYEIILEKQAYLAGDHVTLPDLFHLPLGMWLHEYQPEIFDRRPNVSRWWNDISSRPAWLAVKDGA